MKKLLSLMMACVMILALAVPAFASDPYFSADSESDQLSQSMTFNARTFVPTVKLSLPALTTNPVVLNPYKISYDVNANADNLLNGVEAGSTEQVKQVISPVYAIANDTDVKLKFAFSTTATIGGEMAISNDHVAISETNKKLYMTLVVKKTESTTAPDDNSAAQFLDFSDTANYETIPVKTTESKSSTSIERSLAVPATAGTPNYLLFQFQGDMTRTPTKAWTADDTISVVLAFTFTPESKQDFTATATTADVPATPSAAKDVTLSSGLTVTSSDTPTYHATAPDWALVSAGGLTGVTVASGKLTISKEGQEALATGANTAKVVLSFKDANNIPRTMEVTWTLTRAS